MRLQIIRKSDPERDPLRYYAGMASYNAVENRWEIEFNTVEGLLSLARAEGCAVRLLHAGPGEELSTVVLEDCDDGEPESPDSRDEESFPRA